MANTDRIEDTEFDAIVSGTGFVESVVAGALARSGLKVLHLDENVNYGGDWTTLNLTEFKEFVAKNGELTRFDTLDEAANGELEAHKRGWNVDLTTKGVTAAGTFVETLINSNVGRYLEFKNVERAAVWQSNGFTDLPAGRNAVFKSKDLAPMEKRRLMQFMKYVEDGVPEEWKGRPFAAFATDHAKLNPKLASLVMFAILQMDDAAAPLTAEEAFEKIKVVAASTGRYGPTSMIYPHYGISELPQAMCRVCAIYRGVYILRRGVKRVTASLDSGVTSVECAAGQTFACKHFITSTATPLSGGLSGQAERAVAEARSVLFAKRSLLNHPSLNAGTNASRDPEDGDIGTTFATIPPSSLAPGLPSRTVSVFELTSATMASPEGVFTVHFTQPQGTVAELKRVVDAFVAADGAFRGKGGEPEPERSAIAVAYFTLPSLCHAPIDLRNAAGAALPPAGVPRLWRCPPPSGRSDVDPALATAKSLFAAIMEQEVALRQLDSDGAPPLSTYPPPGVALSGQIAESLAESDLTPPPPPPPPR
ncbi:Rab proteins geranylgeranyltransferase component A [Diplonema papillatum]|nr:Rab proteins geranylgeranyltransferase component A [Diplonema papillatum]